MYVLRQSEEFEEWLAKLRDSSAREIIGKRMVRVQTGLFGDAKPIGGGISELRFNIGPGYRIYYQLRGSVVILLLYGGDKSSQVDDIKRAKLIADRIVI